ncbi:class I adenylate-forming enzyme family protein [Streptomyces sp. NBC_01314]|uniref:class I adenylate-forming enzyme family protein n=1 Tax=Streptomyces sp. NBC_01314 TaxID=2903821 RepID=UPI00308566AE|nr:AMP-binding protein [Streptomyces sp. NBC_01314]
MSENISAADAGTPPGTWFGARLPANAAAAGSRVALVFEDRTWTYAELDLSVRRALGRLAERGVRRGDRVVMRGEARPEAIATMFAVTRMGAVLVPVHPQMTGRELDVVREETEPRAIVADGAFLETLAPGTELRLTWEEISAPDTPPVEADAPPAGSDIAIIAFTSGTSGRPKGAQLTHDNLHWSMVNGMARLPVTEDDVVLVATPLAHVAVLGGLPQYTWAERGTVVLAPKFDGGLFVDLVRDHRVTAAFAVPAMLSLLTRHARFDGPDLDSLRWVLAGGSPAMSSTTTRLLERGVRVVNSYGLTESSAGVTYAVLDEVADRPTSAGPPVPHVELIVVDDKGAAAPVDGVGEIWLRGPSVASSYRTSTGPLPVTDADGWFHTGDRGRYDERGRLEVVGRAKELIITGGENVDPAEVENALADLPRVLEVAVGGTPDPVWGELVTAYVVASAPEPTLDDVRGHLEGRLARHKWPRRLCVVPALPRGATGKLRRKALGDLTALSADRLPAGGGTPTSDPTTTGDTTTSEPHTQERP